MRGSTTWLPLKALRPHDPTAAICGRHAVSRRRGGDRWPIQARPAGADRYGLATNSGHDQIDQFSFPDGDRLDVQGETFTPGTSGDGDVLLTLSGGSTIELNGVTPAGFAPGSSCNPKGAFEFGGIQCR